MDKPAVPSLTMLYAFVTFAFCITVNAQQTIPVPDNLVANLPPIPAAIAEDVAPYTEARSAFLAEWHPVKKKMLITTRFGNAPQIHEVKMPGGDRKQLTFFAEAPSEASFEPVKGEYLLFTKDKGGDEFGSIYRYDYSTGKSTMIAGAPRSQNGGITWNKKGSRILYTSTRRNGKDRDAYMMDPLNPSTDKKVLELEGGGWGVSDWSDDEKYILLTNYISVNESAMWMYEVAANKLTQFLPKAAERESYGGLQFSNDGKSVYILTSSGSQFVRPAVVDITSKKITYLVSDINWEIEEYRITEDGKKAAYHTCPYILHCTKIGVFS